MLEKQDEWKATSSMGLKNNRTKSTRKHIEKVRHMAGQIKIVVGNEIYKQMEEGLSRLKLIIEEMKALHK